MVFCVSRTSKVIFIYGAGVSQRSGAGRNIAVGVGLEVSLLAIYE